nr:hypothetical protein MACL_00001747 [Theileria orientalis]
MNMLFAAMVAVATVSAAPFLLDNELVKNNGHPKLAVFHHVGAALGNGVNGDKLRFVHLMPKVNFLCEFADGLASAHFGGAAKHHTFLKLPDGEHLVEVLGLSNCHDWHVVVMGVWNAAGGSLSHKLFGGVKGEGMKYFGLMDEVADFVNLKLGTAHLPLFKELVAKGLPSHLFTHKLNHKLANRLAQLA